MCLRLFWELCGRMNPTFLFAVETISKRTTCVSFFLLSLLVWLNLDFCPLRPHPVFVPKSVPAQAWATPQGHDFSPLFWQPFCSRHSPPTLSLWSPLRSPFSVWPSFTPTYKAFHYHSPFTPWWGPFTPPPREASGQDFVGGLRRLWP